jgi:hypothetical protein
MFSYPTELGENSSGIDSLFDLIFRIFAHLAQPGFVV